ncbi:MAG: ABC transporter ATP-binding protein [Anaerolineales bacterium]
MSHLRKTLIYLKPYKGWVFIACGLVVIEALAQLVVPMLLKFVIDEGIYLGDMTAILLGSGLMLVAAGVGAVATVRRAYNSAKFSQWMAFDLRNDLFSRIQGFSFGNMDRMQTGNLITRVSSDIDVVRMFAGLGLIMIIRAIVLLFGSLFFLIATDPKLTMIMVFLIPAIGIVFFILAKVAQPLFKLVQQRLDVLNTVVQENLAGVRVVKAFVREPYAVDQFEDANDAYMEKSVKVNRLMVVAFPVVMLIANLGMLAVIILGGAQVIEGTLTVGGLVAFSNYLMTATFPIVMLGMIIAMMPAADASAERILEVLNTESDIQESPTATPLEVMTGKVSFEGVTFNYNGSSEAAVLQEINLVIEPGQSVALLGATGSGKTTLVGLIPRLYEATEGRVLVDGVDVREMTEHSLRSQIGVALQQTTLFSGTIAENIAFGRPEAAMEEVVKAAKAAQAHEFITAMPDGYESNVEARGANLSGGQKQRIAIARALLINPTILILDDSTSSVDMETEFLIQEALDEIMEGRTTFIIAQRISSVLKADQIIILDRGRIVAKGTHRELLDKSPIYQEIFCSQLGIDFEVEGVSADCRDDAEVGAE